MRPFRRFFVCALLAVASLAPSVAAGAAEWGRNTPLPSKPGLYWEKCGGCHGSAGSFAPARLSVVDGTLRVTGKQTTLSAFLEAHPVRLTEEESPVLVETLSDIVTNGAAFHQRCAICHGQVEQFARTQFVLRNGQLAGRYSGRDAQEFLTGHARLDGAGASFFADVLRRFAGRE